MLKSIKISFKESVIYGLGNVAVKIVGLILIPIYTNKEYFPVDEFGVLAILEACGLVLTAVMASALPQSLTRWFWDKDHRENQKGIFFMSLSTQIIVSLAFCLVLIPLSGSVSQLIFSNTNWGKAIILVILASSIQSVNNIINTLMRLQTRSLLYSISNLFKLLIVLSLTLYFVLVKRMGIEGIFLAQVIGNAVIVLTLTGYVFRNIRPFFDRTIFSSMNAYGFPLLLANISAAALSVIDKFSLQSMAVLKSVALYTLAFKIASVLKLVIVDSIKLALGPMMIKRIDSPDNKRFYSKALLYSSYIVMFAIIPVSLFSYELIKIMPGAGDYIGAVVIVPILAISMLFMNMKEVTVYGLHIAKKTNIIGIIVAGVTLFGLGINILLIPVWDITGAAIAYLLSQFVYWLACYYFSQRVFYVPYELRKVLLILIVGAALSFSALLLNGIDLIPRLLLKTCSVLSFPFILYLFKFYEPVELQAIKGFVTKWSKLKNFGANLKSLKGITDEI